MCDASELSFFIAFLLGTKGEVGFYFHCQYFHSFDGYQRNNNPSVHTINYISLCHNAVCL